MKYLVASGIIYGWVGAPPKCLSMHAALLNPFTPKFKELLENAFLQVVVISRSTANKNKAGKIGYDAVNL